MGSYLYQSEACCRNKRTCREDKKDVQLFYDNRKLVEGAVIESSGKIVPMPATKDNADEIRRTICAISALEYGHASQRLFDSCNLLFNKPTYPLDFTKQRKW